MISIYIILRCEVCSNNVERIVSREHVDTYLSRAIGDGWVFQGNRCFCPNHADSAKTEEIGIAVKGYPLTQ